MELPSTRLSRSADPQIQGVAAVALGSSPNTHCDCDTPPEPVPSYSLVRGRAPGDLSPGLAPGDALQSSAKCKVGITQTSLLKRNPFSLAAHIIVSQLKAPVSVKYSFASSFNQSSSWYLKTDYKLFA